MKNLSEGTQIEFKDNLGYIKNSGKISHIFTPTNCKFYFKNNYANGENEDFLFISDIDNLCYSAQNYQRFNLDILN